MGLGLRLILACTFVLFFGANLFGGLVTRDGYSGALHVLFVTSANQSGMLGGVGNADLIVTTHGQAGAVTGPLGLFWRAVLSDSSQNANSIIPATDTDPIYATNGHRIADDFASLFSATQNSLAFDEDGDTVLHFVWTGSTDSGTANPMLTCLDWTSSDITDFAEFGRPKDGATNSHISTGLVTECSSQRALYGISTNKTLGVPAVPEPSSFLCVSLVGLGLAAWRRKKKSRRS